MTTTNTQPTKFDAQTAPAGRTVYFKKNGNDENSGLTLAQAVSADNNFQRVLQVVNNLILQDPTSPVTITTDESDRFQGEFTLPVNVNFFAEGVRLGSLSPTPALTLSQNNRVVVDTIDSGFGDALLLDNSIFCFVNAIAISSTNGWSVRHTNGSFFNTVNVEAFAGSSGCILNDSASSEQGLVVDSDLYNVTADNGVAVSSTSVNRTILSGDYIGSQQGTLLTGVKAISASGPVTSDISDITADVAIEALNGANISVAANTIAGDIDTNVGSIASVTTVSPYTVGTITENGTFNANLGGDTYGSYIAGVNAAGNDTEVQYNDNGVLGADVNFTFDGTELSVPAVNTSALDLNDDDTNKISIVAPVDVTSDYEITFPDSAPTALPSILTFNLSGESQFSDIGSFLYSERNQTETPGVTITSGTKFTYLTLNATVPADGDYIISCAYVWSYDSTNSDFLADIQEDGNPIPNLVVVREPTDNGGPGIVAARIDGPPGSINTGTNQRYDGYLETERNLTAGNYTYTFRIGSGSGSVAACYRATLKIETA